MQKLGRGDISELWKPPRIESFPNHHCPTCGELIPLTSPTKLFGYGSVRSLDTAASLDCPSCSLQLQERPRKRPSTERMLLPEGASCSKARYCSARLASEFIFGHSSNRGSPTSIWRSSPWQWNRQSFKSKASRREPSCASMAKWLGPRPWR